MPNSKQSTAHTSQLILSLTLRRCYHYHPTRKTEALWLVQGHTASAGRSRDSVRICVTPERSIYFHVWTSLCLDLQKLPPHTLDPPPLMRDPLFCHRQSDSLTPVLAVLTCFHYVVGVLWDSTTGCFSDLFNSSIMLWSHLLFYIGQM